VQSVPGGALDAKVTVCVPEVSLLQPVALHGVVAAHDPGHRTGDPEGRRNIHIRGQR